jgi:hypothetical protein
MQCNHKNRFKNQDRFNDLEQVKMQRLHKKQNLRSNTDYLDEIRESLKKHHGPHYEMLSPST